MSKERSNFLLEIRGILRTLSDDYGQSICSKKRLFELIEFLKKEDKKEVLI